MGGLGSGRPKGGGRSKTTSMLKIDARLWNRKGLVIPGKRFKWQWLYGEKLLHSMEVSMQARHFALTFKAKTLKICQIQLSWTDCGFGGQRVWFICPVSGCGLRVAVLYFSGSFACRHCLNLSYPSQCETIENRLIRKGKKIRYRLGWNPGLLCPDENKPKGMHWRIFDKYVFKLKQIASEATDQCLKKIYRKFPDQIF